MRGVVISGDSTCAVREFPDPEPGPGEVRVKMVASGICGSDLHFYHQTVEQNQDRDNCIIGHEPCGIVDMVGQNVNRIQAGDRVSVYHYLGCGHCEYCGAGQLMWCRETRAYGTAVHGSHADFVIADERNCVPLPDGVRFTDGSFVACTGGTAYASMQKLGLRAGHTIAVFGLGPVGLSAVLLAKTMGGHVIAVDIVQERIDLARKIGADTTVNARDDDPAEAIRDSTGGEGVQLAFEASGSAQGRENIVDSLGRNGKAVFVGFGGHDKVIDPGLILTRQITLMGSFVLPLGMAWEMVACLEARSISFEPIVTHRFTIDRASEAYRTFDDGKSGKVVFEWA